METCSRVAFGSLRKGLGTGTFRKGIVTIQGHQPGAARSSRAHRTGAPGPPPGPGEAGQGLWIFVEEHLGWGGPAGGNPEEGFRNFPLLPLVISHKGLPVGDSDKAQAMDVAPAGRPAWPEQGGAGGERIWSGTWRARDTDLPRGRQAASGAQR